MEKVNYNKLKSLAKHINQLIACGKWNSLATNEQSALTSALARLVSLVRRFLSKRKLARALGAAVTLIGTNAGAQSFADPVLDPFEIIPTEDNYYIKPQFVDIDGDGDQDYFYSRPYELGFVYQENIGTAETPTFSDIVINPFELSATDIMVTPVFGDLDNDGDFDMLCSNYDSFIISYYENIGTTTDPEFEDPVIMPFGIAPEVSITNDLVDIDNDGDLDLFSTGYNTDDDSGYKLSFHENIGTPESPNFTAGVINPLGVDVTLEDYWFFVDFADIDEDGDLDFIRTDFYGKLVYFHENIGDAETAEFDSGLGEDSPFDIDPLGIDEYFMGPKMVDIDADGDLDLFISEYYGGNFFFENLEIDLDDDVSIADLNTSLDQISVHPNPSNDFITINSDLTSKDIESIQITSIDGQEIYRTKIWDKMIPVSDYPSGIYILTVNQVNGERTQIKFTKE